VVQGIWFSAATRKRGDDAVNLPSGGGPNRSQPRTVWVELVLAKDGHAALTAGKVVVAVPVVAVLAPLWVLSKLGEGMAQNPAATAVLLQQLQANQPTQGANALNASLMTPAPTTETATTCPIGSHPWVDNWGNKICKRFEDGSTATIQSSTPDGCPVGSYPWVDNWGNRICQSWGGGRALMTPLTAVRPALTPGSISGVIEPASFFEVLSLADLPPGRGSSSQLVAAELSVP
jgi:hypothetical protein